MNYRDLFPFQVEGARFLRSRRYAYLGDEMGLGKTVQALIAAQHSGAHEVQVICPASLVENWKREARVWAPHLRLEAMSYDRVRIDESIAWRDPDVIIVDEAHYLKNPKAKRTKAVVKQLRDRKRVWLLSGTPMPNDPRELYVPARILNPLETKGFTYWKWTRTFCQTIDTPWGLKVVGIRNADKLRRIFAGTFLGRRLEQVALDLPPLRITTESLPRAEKLPEEVTALLRAMQDEELGDETSTSRLRRLLGELKAPLVAKRIVDELNEGQYDATVVMAYHRDVLTSLQKAFEAAGYPTVRVDGSTPPRARQEAVDTFQAGDATVFLGQQGAAGVGITLTRASELVLLEPAWSPDENRQAIKRIHRISQDAPCRARIFTLPGTLDEAVMGTLVRKTRIQKEVGL